MTPPRSRRAGYIQPFPNLLLTTLAVVSAAVVFRAPLHNQHRHVKHQAADETPNLLLSTLSTPAAPQAPFTPEETAQARQRVLRAQDTSPAPNLVLVQVQSAAAEQPFIPPEYGQVRPLRRVQSGVEQAAPVLLSARIPGLPQLPEDQPQLRVARAQDTNGQPNLLLSTLLPPASADPPFEWVDFTQPRPLRRVQLQEVQNQLTGVLSGDALAPPAPFAWVDFTQPRPLRRVQPTVELNLLTNTLAVVIPPEFTPFVPQQDIAQPRPLRRVQLQPELNLLTSTLAPVLPPAPFAWVDFTQPRPLRRVQSWSEQVALVLSSTPSGQPVVPDDQPRMRVARAQDTNGQPNLLLSTLIKYDPLPFRETWWEMPRPRRRIPDAFFPGVNALIPNERPPYVAPPDELPGACYYALNLGTGEFELDLGVDEFNVRVSPEVFTIHACEHGGGCMTCKTENYAAAPFVKAPGSTRQVVLNLYEFCVNFRKPNEPVDLAEFVRPRNGTGFAYECTAAGTTGEHEPDWPTEIDATVRDGSATFTCRAPALNGVNVISAPSGVSVPSGLTISNVAVVEGWKVVATYAGGTLGQDYTAEFTATRSGLPIVFSQLVQIRRQ